MSPDDLQALERVLEAMSRSTEEHLFVSTALFAKLDRPRDVEALLQGAADRAAVWPVVAAAVQLARGPHVVLTQHGFTTSLAAMSAARVAAVLNAINVFLRALEQRFGVSAYYTSGTLLGLKRSGRLIAHDDDIDTAYVSAQAGLINVMLERLEMLRFINSMPGHRAEDHLPGLLHCYIPLPDDEIRFDLFTGWVEGGFVAEYPLPRGLLATSSVLPTRIEQHYGLPLPVPAVPEDLLMVNYGPAWRTPDPTFRFDWDAAGCAYGSTLEGFRWRGVAQQRHWLDRETHCLTAVEVPSKAMSAWNAARHGTDVLWVSPSAPDCTVTTSPAVAKPASATDFGFVQQPGLLFLRDVCVRASGADAHLDALLRETPTSLGCVRVQARLDDGSLVLALEPQT